MKKETVRQLIEKQIDGYRNEAERRRKMAFSHIIGDVCYEEDWLGVERSLEQAIEQEALADQLEKLCKEHGDTRQIDEEK